MNTNLLTEPRSNAFSLLIQFDQLATVRELAARSLRPQQRLSGEILLNVHGRLANTELPVSLERLGLYSLGTPPGTMTGELAVSAVSGDGLLRPVASNLWDLAMTLDVRLIYEATAGVRERESDLDYQTVPFETAKTSLSLQLAISSTKRLDRRLQLVSGRVKTREKSISRGPFDSLVLDLATSPVHTKAYAVDTQVVLPVEISLQPVVFPLGRATTGYSWGQQLARANEVWEPCSISFRDEGVLQSKDPLALSRELAKVRTSNPKEGAIEVYFVASAVTAWTCPLGSALATVVIPENVPPDALLLAHELGHVLGLCHPTLQDCKYPAQPGEVDSILDISHRRLVASNPASNCQLARKCGLELLKTKL